MFEIILDIIIYSLFLCVVVIAIAVIHNFNITRAFEEEEEYDPIMYPRSLFPRRYVHANEDYHNDDVSSSTA